VGVNHTALPRAWVAYDWRRADNRGEALRTTLASTTATLRNRPVIEGVPPSSTGGPPSSSAASVVDNSTDTVTVNAVARRPGYLILDDSAYPGWVATLDGRPTSWHPANENFRAVAIPAGRHTVTFRYRPASVRDGAIVSGLSVLALIGLALAGLGGVHRRRLRR
jgi:uncharacterized membrane protein YfhO